MNKKKSKKSSKKILIIIIMIICLGILFGMESAKPTVCIDAGHGGKDVR